MVSLPDLHDGVKAEELTVNHKEKKINDSRLNDFVVSPIHI